MPRAGGVYSAPPGTTATPNTTVASAPYNALVADLVADANAARPVTAGGIGASTAIGGLDNLNVAGASIASASTVNLANATGAALTITGTVTINSFGTVTAGAERVLTFAAALQLTYNATSMILPGAANIMTAAGDVAIMRSLGGGNWQCVSYTRASGTPIAISSPTITGPTTITNAAAGDALILTSSDAGGGSGPSVSTLRNSASPAAFDVIGEFSASGKNSSGSTVQYVSIGGQILDPNAGTEDGQFRVNTIVAGVFTNRFNVAAGAYTFGATGGDKGSGTINAAGLYVNGAQIPFSKSYESGQQTITAGGSLTLAHGLGVQPKLVSAALVCQSSDSGYSTGDEVEIAQNLQSNNNTTSTGVAIVPDATNLNCRYGSTGGVFNILNKSSGVAGLINSASWKLVVRAWA